ncbi:unnamed protein product [Urochloa decumbens]
MKNKNRYACVSNHSKCTDGRHGYNCLCNAGTQGNPYIRYGCSGDKGYNPVQQKTNCTRQCSNISIPFPFGLEEGCFAREQFRVKCSNTTPPILPFSSVGPRPVSYIDIEEGLVGIAEDSGPQSSEEFTVSTLMSSEDILDWPTEIYLISMITSSSYVQRVQWAVANLTCEEAKQNSTGYACVSANSTCLGVNSASDEYVGYRCKCMRGFEGNPYIPHGCQDVDECHVTPSICKGICHNTIGSYNCTVWCPTGNEYDPITMKCTSTTRRQILRLGIVIGLTSGFGILFLILSISLIIRTWKKDIKRQLRQKHFQKNHGLLLEQLLSSDENASDKTNIFSLEGLEKATNNFDPTRILGRGGHGTVFKGILTDQRVVAIKKSKVIEQGEISQFINEVAILTQINHRNIVKLFGCCLETEVPLLVYDFIPNGSLSDVLHGNASGHSWLSWDNSLRIAVEAAGALNYLHSAASVSVFHRDVKSSNILLDGNYTAKVSDFGASRLVSIDQTHVYTNIQGTFGYLDPEYYRTGKLNEKSDVYSFGVVLIELLLRKEPIFTCETGLKQNLSNYFLQEMKVKPLAEIVAASVLEEATEEEINDVASLAEICLRLQSEERPTMKQVEVTLQSVRSKRLKTHQIAASGNEDLQPLLTRQSQTTGHSSLAVAFDMVARANLASQSSRHCYSLEQEFMSSASFPR